MLVRFKSDQTKTFFFTEPKERCSLWRRVDWPQVPHHQTVLCTSTCPQPPTNKGGMQKWKLSRKIYLAYVFVPCLAPKSHARSALIDKKIGLNFAPEKAGGGGGWQTFRSSVGTY